MTPRNRIFGWIRSFFSVILISCITLFTIFFFVSSALVRILSSPETLIRILDEAQFAQHSKSLIADIFVRYSSGSEQAASFMSAYPTEVLESVAEVVLPTDWINDNVQNIMGSLSVWLFEEDKDIPDFNLDFSIQLDLLRSRSGSMVIMPLLQNIPACPEGAETFILSDRLISCVPMDRDLTDTAQEIASRVADSLPQSVSTASLQQAGLVSPEMNRMIRTAHRGFQTLLAARRSSLSLSLFLFSLYLLLYSRVSLPIFLRKSTVPLFSISFASLVILAALYFIVKSDLRMMLSAEFPTLGTETLILSANLIQSFSILVCTRWATWLVPFFLTALALLLSGTIIQSYLDRNSIIKKQSRPAVVRKQFR